MSETLLDLQTGGSPIINYSLEWDNATNGDNFYVILNNSSNKM